MNKLIINNEQLKGLVAKICRDITNSNWRPDYVVGLTRGGLIPAVMISHYFGVPCETLKVSLRDGGECESNLWMPHDALGLIDNEITVADENDIGSILEAASDLLEQSDTYKNILIVDDINDTGATVNWIINDWPSGCYPNDPRWENDIWNVNVRFAMLVDNLSSDAMIKMDYTGMEVNKAENDVWIDFPWEDWWAK